MTYTGLKGRARIEQFLRAVSLEWKIIDWRRDTHVSELSAHVVRHYPIGKGVVDYALFVEGRLLAIILVYPQGGNPLETMHRAEKAAHAISQSGAKGHSVPFLYVADGESIYHRDARKAGNVAYRVYHFHGPRALQDGYRFPDSGDLEIIRQMEKILRVPLKPMGLEEIEERFKIHGDIKRGYALDDSGRVSGLRVQYLNVTGILLLLPRLEYLRKLDIAACRLDNTFAAIFRQYGKLETLDISNNKGFTDYSFLLDLPALTSLGLSHTGLKDVSFLRDLPALISLDLKNTGLKDVSFLRDLPALTFLDLTATGTKDASFLRDLPALTSLSLSYSQLSNVSFLQGFPALTSLDLSFNNLKDVSFL
ncbi:MAG: hypothetical protein GY765_01630, partial [bacterium]|nr:hypothetical protein [bacterium]